MPTPMVPVVVVDVDPDCAVVAEEFVDDDDGFAETAVEDDAGEPPISRKLPKTQPCWPCDVLTW